MQKKGNGLGVFFYEDDQVHNGSRGGRGEIINLSFTSFGRKDVLHMGPEDPSNRKNTHLFGAL